MDDSEVWKDVAGYEGVYQVSNLGRVRSVDRLVKYSDERKYTYKGKIIKPICDKGGYTTVNLYKNGKSKTKKIHRLVAETFIPNHNNYLEINHKDEYKTNNHVENLEWCTREYNNNYGKRTEKASQTQSKRVKAVNVETGEVITFISTMEAGRKGYAHGVVSSACRGVYKSGTGKLIGDGHLYRGHKWSYE